MEVKEYMESYKKKLEYLSKMKDLHYEDSEVINDIIKSVRKDFFSTFFSYIVHYFYDFDHNPGHMEDSELFTYENHSKAIRKFNGAYYSVNVKQFGFAAVTTESPDDYPLHIMPQQGVSYPEYLIADYLIAKGF
jgi:hypothetical protein